MKFICLEQRLKYFINLLETICLQQKLSYFYKSIISYLSGTKSAVFCKSVVSQVPWELSGLPEEQRLVYVRNNHFFISILFSSWLSKVLKVPYQLKIIFSSLLCFIFFHPIFFVNFLPNLETNLESYFLTGLQRNTS